MSLFSSTKIEMMDSGPFGGSIESLNPVVEQVS